MRRLSPIAALALLAAGCGGSSTPPATTTQAASTQPAPATATATATGPGALQAEVKATAAGDIPDNQVFVVFDDKAAGYSIKYPEGWAQQGAGDVVTFRDKNNIVRIVVTHGAATANGVRRDIAALKGAQVDRQPQPVTIGGSKGFKVVYRTVSAPNPVTGKRVTLVVDRYYLSRGGKEAIVDLGSPQGVDNVDAYRLMIESFRWR